MTARWPAAVAAVAAVLLLPACTSFADTVPSASSSPSSPSAAAKSACPAQRARPEPDRPVVALDFRLADDRHTVTGTDRVTFTPDRRTDQLVFRLVPNGSEAAGNRLVVDSARGSDVDRGDYVPDGAAAPGGLYVVQLHRWLSPGHSTTVELAFTLTLGSGAFDRFGAADGVSWWGSGAPLLAWQPGVGWARDPFVHLLGETATSPAADTTVRVSAPQDLTVLMTGAQAAPSAAADGRRTWTSREAAARDVSVVVGRFTTRERTTHDGVRVTTGVLPGSHLTADRLAEWTTSAIAGLETTLGPFPYDTLTVPLLPDFGGGIEYPSTIQLAVPNRAILVHEVAHMWFYGMVGNSQFRDPWLDEALATYAEALHDPRAAGRDRSALNVPGDVGASMAELDRAGERSYFTVVYGKGAAALLTARDAAGTTAFDAALRCYIDANAWRIATPADLAAALADLPKALDALRKAGALDPADLPR